MTWGSSKQAVAILVSYLNIRLMVGVSVRCWSWIRPPFHTLYTTVITIFFCFTSHVVAEDDFTIYQPDNPPWGSLDTGDGFIVAIVTEAFRRAEIPYRSVFVPWKRGQRQVIETDDGFMAPLTRIERREDLYQWVAPINISFLQLVTADENLLQKEWKHLLEMPVVGRMESPAEFTLKKLGFRYITIVENEKAAARIVIARRIPMWMQRGLPGNWAYLEAGGVRGDLHVIKRWTTPLQYLAASTNVPEDVIEKLRQTLISMRVSGDIDAIKQSYFSYTLDCAILIGCAQKAEP